MKLKSLAHYRDFIDTVQKCRADVYYFSNEGDRLNLKSTLSQFLFASLCGDRNFLLRGCVECLDVNDYAQLSRFLQEDA